MASKPKLKPCPFCGGEAQLLRISKSPNGVEEWFVSCGSDSCDLYPHSTIPYASAEIAAAAWNRRADNTRSAPVGNAAAIRKALQRMVDWFNDGGFDEDAADEMDSMVENAEAALAAPPRNCDRPECQTTREAARVWRLEDGGKTAYHEWLLAPATE